MKAISMSDIDTLVRLLEGHKKDIIKLIDTKTDAIQGLVENQSGWIEKIDKLVDQHEKIITERGLTCLPTMEALKPTQKVASMLRTISENKTISVIIAILSLFTIQSVVYAVFQNLAISEIFKLIYK